MKIKKKKHVDKMAEQIQKIIELYQKEIKNTYPVVNVQELKRIWEKMDTPTDIPVGDKKKKTAYQNYFVHTRQIITKEEPDLKFGDISKKIASMWNTMSANEKRNYESNNLSEALKNNLSSSSCNINKKSLYMHVFENNGDEHDETNRIDYEHDDVADDDIEDTIDDDEDENMEDEIDFDEIE